jgi:List-Bact-rpt repeat protein
MPDWAQPARVSRTAVWAMVAVVALLLLTALPVSGARFASAPGGGNALRAGAAPAGHEAVPVPAVHPEGSTNVSLGTVYASTELPPSAPATTPCMTANYIIILQSSCYPQTQNPSIVTLANGHFGVGYSIYTTIGPLCNATGNTTNLTSWTASNVAWSTSLSNASAWSAATFLGTTSCRWPSASEPTFATGTAGTVDGAYILSNQTINATGPGGTQPYLPPDWSAPVGDALAFVHSGDNGTTWSNVTLVPNVTAAVRPQMAVFGHTVYIVYVYTNNSTASYPGGNGLGTFNALAVQMVVSKDSGVTWGKPVVLPGQNASMANWSSAPSIAVNKTGGIAVAYATNRSCLSACAYPLSPNSIYGEQIVVARSIQNGTTWIAPRVAGNWTGESYTYTAYADAYSFSGYGYPWMSTPQTSIAIGPTGTTLYVAYSGTFFKSAAYAYLDWLYTGVFAAYSTNSGVTWTNSTVASESSVSNNDNFYSPGIAVSGTTAYIAYVWLNGTYCFTSGGCPDFEGTVSSWIASSTNGVNWTSNLTGITPYGTPAYIANDFQGWGSTVTISSTGSPVAATTLPSAYSYSFSAGGPPYVYTFDYWTNVSIAYVYTGPTTSVSFVEHNLSAGASWGIAFDGLTIPSNQTSIRIANVPLHVAIPVGILPRTTTAYRTIHLSSLSIRSPYEFVGPKAVDVNFTTEYGLQIWVEPTLSTFTEQISMFLGGTFYFVESFGGYTYAGPSFPWYFPANVTETFQASSSPPFTYWNGSGKGSYTGGGGELNITLGGPVNETGWAGSYGVYTEGFYATGLPAASKYSFDFAGATHTSVGSNWTYVPNVQTGGYTVSNITANASPAGWEYFGRVAGGSNTVVVPAQPTVGFDFALVNVAAPVGQVTFHAQGIPAGTVWSVAFNGTEYSASTPWLNVSTRPGTYPWAPGAAVAANGVVGYQPVGFGPTLTLPSVPMVNTVNISYAYAFQVLVVSGLGGAATGVGAQWLAAGANASFVATPAGGYAFGGWTGSGAGSYTGTNLTANITVGGPITESASFFPLPASRFNVTFDETGIPSGAWWTVYLDGVGYSSNGSSLTVSNLLSCAAGTAGQYREAVGVAFDNATGSTRYIPVNPTTFFCTTGGTIQPVTFAPQYRVSVSATLGGTAYVAVGSVQSTVSVWAYSRDVVQLSTNAGSGYSFGGWSGTGPGSYTGAEPDPPISVGGPVTELATFVPVSHPARPTYTIEFAWSVGYLRGTTWNVTVGNASYAGIGPDINVSGLFAQAYTATVSGATSSDGNTKWTPTLSKIAITVSQNATQPVIFGPPSYWVAIGGSAGGSESPISGWFASGAPLDLNAVPNVGQKFGNWTGTGAGSYSGNQSVANLTVNAPLTEFASFHPSISATTAATSVWSNVSTWVVLAAIGLFVGLLVGIAVRRMRTERPPPNKEPEPRTSAGEGP